MAREDYEINGVNISTIVRKEKQKYGKFNLTKAKKILDQYNILYDVIEQGIRFTLQDIKYTYWSKKNRVYNGIKDTGLTLNAFIKENKELFIKKNNVSTVEVKENSKNEKNKYIIDGNFAFGKYKGKSLEWVKENNISYLYWCETNIPDFNF